MREGGGHCWSSPDKNLAKLFIGKRLPADRPVCLAWINLIGFENL